MEKPKLELGSLGQISVVVKDIEKVMKYYSETFGTGPNISDRSSLNITGKRGVIFSSGHKEWLAEGNLNKLRKELGQRGNPLLLSLSG